MTFLKTDRTKQSFEDRLAKKAPGTRELYQITFRNFEKFCTEHYSRTMGEVITEFAVVDEQAVIDTLQDWIDWNVSQKKSPMTVRMWFSCINNYLRYKGISIDTKENIDFPKKKEEELYPLQLEDIHKLFSVAKFDKKCLYLCQISSGMRIAELLQLKRKDLEIKERIIVKIPADYTKSKKGRTTFFSIEAQKMLTPKLNRLNDDDFVFGKHNNTPLKSKTGNEQITLGKYLGKVGLDERYDNGHHKITTHSFRAYFITKISRHDPNFAKKLVGQKGYLLQYDRMTDEEKLERYIEFEDKLLVFDQSIKDAEIIKLRKDNEEKNRLLGRIKTLEEQRKIEIKNLKKKQSIVEKNKEESIANRQMITELQTHVMELQFGLKAVTTSVQTKYDDELQQRKEELGMD